MEIKAYDERLRSAMEEFKGIAEKYNIGAHVLLASDSHSEFWLGLDVPDWSSIILEDGGFRIRAQSAVEGDHEKLEKTMHMLLTFRDMMINHAGAISAMEGQIRKKVDITHKSRIGKRPDSWPLGENR